MFFFISDLHYGMNPKGDAATRRVAAKLEAESGRNDTLLIGGDIATDDERLLECLRLFRGFRGEKMAIAGNHDVWVRPGGNSLERYKKIPLLMARAGFQPLEESPARLNGWGIVGAMGWYDYSFRDGDAVPASAFETKRDPITGRIVWSDAKHIRWHMTDSEATEWQVERLASCLAEVRTERVIALVHHVPRKDLLFHPRWLVPRKWRFANTFLGSNRFAEVLEQDGRVRLCVNGHIHMERHVKRGGIEYHSIGGDYLRKQILCFDGKRISRISIA